VFPETELPEMGFSETRSRAIGNDKAPGLFTEGFYRYSVSMAIHERRFVSWSITLDRRSVHG
jgi:hypothetical protein